MSNSEKGERNWRPK